MIESTDSPMAPAANIAPLAWVIGEIRNSLAAAAKASEEFLGDRRDIERLRRARDRVHQANGALQLLDLRGVALVADAVEQILRRYEDEPELCTASSVRTIDRALIGIIAYLEGLLAGRANQPLLLFPYFRDVQALTPGARAQAADLLFPDLTRRPPFHQVQPRGLTTDELRVRRSRFESGLLGFLRNPQDPSPRRQMQDALEDLEYMPQRGLARSFWWVTHALLEALAEGGLAVDLDVKRLLARINLQLRRMIEGSGAVAERLMVDTLFFVGRADPALPRVAEVRSLYALDSLIPPDFETPTLTPRDARATEQLAEAIATAKSAWSALVEGVGTVAAFQHEMKLAASAAARLDAAPVAEVIAAVNAAAATWPGLPEAARETLALELAQAMLFIDLGIAALPQLDPDYAPRAVAMAQRLHAAASGQALADTLPWLSELARREQDRSALASLVAETQTLLREIEQRLDAFFRDPAAGRADLAATDSQFDQIAGALAVLGHAAPVAALREAQAAVRRWCDPQSVAESAAFDRVAQSLGALGFFVEELREGAQRPAGVFQFGADDGAFSAAIGVPAAKLAASDDELLPAPETVAVEPANDGVAAPDNVESVARANRAAAESAAFTLAGFPDAAAQTAALGELGRLLPLLAQEAEILDDAALKTLAVRAQPLLARLRDGAGLEVAAQLLALFAPTAGADAVTPSAPLPATQAAADLELLAIFVEEAREVLETIDGELAEMRRHPSDKTTITNVRRAFHTLKGSSRMVGLKPFGEGAWAAEQCFNLWLAQERPATDDLIQLAVAARHVMAGWVDAIESNPAAALDFEPLVLAASRVREGGAFRLETELVSVSAPVPSESAEDSELPDFNFDDLDASIATAAAAPGELPEESLPALLEEPRREEVRRIGPLEISHGLYSVFLTEADECMRVLAQDMAEWRYEPGRSVTAQSARRAHSLAGITATVGLGPVLSIAGPLDDLMHELSILGPSRHFEFAPPQFDTLERVTDRMRGMLHQFSAGVYPDEAPLEAAAVHDLLIQVRAHAALHAEGEPAVEAGMPPLTADGALAEHLEVGEPANESLAAPEEFETFEIEAAPALDDVAFSQVDAALALTDLDDFGDFGSLALIEPAPLPLTGLDSAERVAIDAPPLELDDADSKLRDEIDPELLDIFVVESHEQLPAIGADLRALSEDPDNREVARALMRRLHTVKGSARMAGAMRLGELVHAMETRIENSILAGRVPAEVVDQLQTQYDRALQLFDALQIPAPVAPIAPVADGVTAVSGEPALAAEPAASGVVELAAPAAAASFIRVRADVLDRLVDQAGEVAIARSKLENEVGTMRASLTDLTENIARLRGQLREVSIQAEAQISARGEHLSRESENFDPLEFDRFTRLQELTRLLAESVEDVALVHGNMVKGLQMAEHDLVSQSRLTRDLQQQLMRVRLVPFSNVSERLYRVARQTAKELDKRVHLEIRGGATEIDRGVLERMAAPFEHLVRNAIVHGVERPAAREQAGKPELGELKIEVRQEGNEIIVTFADDGAGLALDRIRERAAARGVVAAGQELSERELMDLIFAPGFTTVDEITELAGRGVGMDVVRSELASFGGRVTVASDAGRGTRFTLYLPLTLAVTQVVLATVGQRRWAIPAAMVEQVRRLRPMLLEQSLAEGVIDLPPAGPVVLRPLAQLIDDEVGPLPHKPIPVVLVRSGEDRLAISVDDVSSNQEVVVKNVGAQVARLAGILGATILGNGEVVLIINPVQFITRAPEPAPVFEPVASLEPAAPAAPVVMVVDDSITVRRVTQRLLERQGWEVLLAKDGVDALRQLQDVRPDIMLVDIEMPRMDGFDLTRHVRSSRATAGIPIVMITSRTADKHRSTAFELGVNEYLGKPYQEEELLAVIKRYMADRERV
ncbi:MAG: Hpt domain-containing protein [Burkholderiaceae bacterium]